MYQVVYKFEYPIDDSNPERYLLYNVYKFFENPMSYLIKVFFSLLDLELFIEFGGLCQKDVEKCDEKLPLGCSKFRYSEKVTKI